MWRQHLFRVEGGAILISALSSFRTVGAATFNVIRLHFFLKRRLPHKLQHVSGRSALNHHRQPVNAENLSSSGTLRQTSWNSSNSPVGQRFVEKYLAICFVALRQTRRDLTATSGPNMTSRDYFRSVMKMPFY